MTQPHLLFKVRHNKDLFECPLPHLFLKNLMSLTPPALKGLTQHSSGAGRQKVIIKSAGVFDLGLGNTAKIINVVSEPKQEHLQLLMPDASVTSSLSLAKDEGALTVSNLQINASRPGVTDVMPEYPMCLSYIHPC